MKTFMENFSQNWLLYATFACALIYFVQRIIEFIGYPTAKKKATVMAELLDWVREAEAELGSGTGSFKLSKVYGRFAEQCPAMTKWITLEQFNEWVKKALADMETSFSNEVTKNNALQLNKGSGDT